MATAYDILRCTGSTGSYTIEKLSETAVVLQSVEALPNGSRATYVVASGDETHPTTIVFVTKVDPNANKAKGTRTCTVAVNSWAHATYDDGSEAHEPFSMAIHVNMPSNLRVEVADVQSAVEILFSLLYGSLTAGDPDTDRLSKLALFGIPDILG